MRALLNLLIVGVGLCNVSFNYRLYEPVYPPIIREGPACMYETIYRFQVSFADLNFLFNMNNLIVYK